MIFELTVKRYFRHTATDNRYSIETVYCNKEQLDKWLKKNNDGWFCEVLNYKAVEV